MGEKVVLFSPQCKMSAAYSIPLHTLVILFVNGAVQSVHCAHTAFYRIWKKVWHEVQLFVIH